MCRALIYLARNSYVAMAGGWAVEDVPQPKRKGPAYTHRALNLPSAKPGKNMYESSLTGGTLNYTKTLYMKGYIRWLR